MFVCGPTVQSLMHLGHARTYIFYDVVARYLSWLGYDVNYLMNITDVDERITTAARESHSGPVALARRFSANFLEDMAALKITSVTRFEPVSRHISEMIRQVSGLLKKRRAYAVDGWVYFDTSTFPSFGRLSHQSKRELSLRPLELSLRKRNLLDFALWRPETLLEGKWRSPWGTGSPGWHIQDTAVTLSLLGARYDIHGGAYDLVYPHHEAEIAQAESLTGKRPVVRYWIHTKLVNMKGEKMSKSLGNVVPVMDALKFYTADELRFFFLSTHYRRDMDLKGIDRAARRLQELRRLTAKLGTTTKGPKTRSPDLPSSFVSAMNDDFDTPRAIDSLESLLKRISAEPKEEKRASDLARALSATGILGVDIVG
jgi:cysteinyl-tRNA synthetase